jgi:hypothetical protein
MMQNIWQTWTPLFLPKKYMMREYFEDIGSFILNKKYRMREYLTGMDTLPLE